MFRVNNFHLRGCSLLLQEARGGVKRGRREGEKEGNDSLEPEGNRRQKRKESPNARAEGKNGNGGSVIGGSGDIVHVAYAEDRRKIFLMSKDFQVLTQNGGCSFKSAC